MDELACVFQRYRDKVIFSNVDGNPALKQWNKKAALDPSKSPSVSFVGKMCSQKRPGIPGTESPAQNKAKKFWAVQIQLYPIVTSGTIYWTVFVLPHARSIVAIGDAAPLGVHWTIFGIPRAGGIIPIAHAPVANVALARGLFDHIVISVRDDRLHFPLATGLRGAERVKPRLV